MGGFLILHDPFAQPIEVAEDDRQQVVEIVGNAPSQMADGFHFLGLNELALGHLTFGDLVLQVPRSLHDPPFQFLFCLLQLGLGFLALGNLLLKRAGPFLDPRFQFI